MCLKFIGQDLFCCGIVVVLLLSGFSHHLWSAEWFSIALFHFVLSNTSSTVSPILFIIYLLQGSFHLVSLFLSISFLARVYLQFFFLNQVYAFDKFSIFYVVKLNWGKSGYKFHSLVHSCVKFVVNNHRCCLLSGLRQQAHHTVRHPRRVKLPLQRSPHTVPLPHD